MKKNLLITMLSILLFSCNNSDEKSDAFGNFETEPIIVSSESSGKIIQLNIEKGQKIETGFVTAIIDTVQFDLKLKQIEAQKASIVARRQSVQSQIGVFEEQIKIPMLFLGHKNIQKNSKIER